MGRKVCFALSALTFGVLPLQAQTGSQDSVRADTVVLRPIQVSVTRSPTPLSDVPWAVGFVSGNSIRDGRPTLGLDEALVEVPGVAVSNRYNPSQDQRISIRGFGARSPFGVRGVKILIDGIPQTLPDGQGQLSNLDLESVGSIEVLRGSASSLYGNASGGVIDIRSVTPNTRSAAAWGSVTGGAFGAFKWRGGVSTPISNGSFAITGGRTIADGFREHSTANQWQVGLRFEKKLGAASTLLVNGQFSDAPQLDNPGSLNQAELDEDPSQANARNVSADAGKTVAQHQLGVTFRQVLSNGGRIELMGFGLMRDLDNPLSFARITIDRVAVGARAVVTLPMIVGRSLPYVTFGFDLQRQRDDRVNETPDRTSVVLDQLENVTEIGPFARLRWPVTDDVTLTLGGRYDRVTFDADDRLLTNGDDSGSRSLNAASGSIGAVYRFSRGVQGYVNVSSSFETPTTTELTNRPTGLGGFNPDLDPQTAKTFEVGFRGLVSRRLAFDVAVFHTDVTDALIPFEVTTDPGRRFFRNAGSTTHRGIEISGTLRVQDNLRTLVAYTLGDYTFGEFRTADETFDGNSLPGVPKHRLHHSVRAQTNTGVWIALDNTYSSSMFMNDANTVETDGYLTTGLRVGATVYTREFVFSPFVGVLNLFDNQYVGSAVVNARFGRFFEPAPRRNAYAGMRVRWR